MRTCRVSIRALLKTNVPLMKQNQITRKHDWNWGQRKIYSHIYNPNSLRYCVCLIQLRVLQLLQVLYTMLFRCPSFQITHLPTVHVALLGICPPSPSFLIPPNTGALMHDPHSWSLCSPVITSCCYTEWHIGTVLAIHEFGNGNTPVMNGEAARTLCSWIFFN